MKEALEEHWEEGEGQLNFGLVLCVDFLCSFTGSRLETTMKDLDA